VKALVCFHNGVSEDGRQHWAAPLLRDGFRHVFCAVQSGNAWITVDALQGVPAVEVVAPADYDLAAFYRSQDGFTVIETERREKPLLSPLVATNCVGMVVGILALRTAAVTPYGLFRHLTRGTSP
jgi:hypothetical protein